MTNTTDKIEIANDRFKLTSFDIEAFKHIQLDATFLTKNEALEVIIESVDGVDWYETSFKYSARIHVAEMFSIGKVMREIEEKINQFIAP